MAFYDTENQDLAIDRILRFLFDYQPAYIKAQQYIDVIALLDHLELAAMYQLFALIKEQLPFRAKICFAAEDYQGKKMMILEVMQHLCHRDHV